MKRLSASALGQAEAKRPKPARAATTKATPAAPSKDSKDSAPATAAAETDFLFFYGSKTGEYALFSQFAKAPFTVTHAGIAAALDLPVAQVDAIVGSGSAETAVSFAAAEQFMMYCKAVCFDDAAVAPQILRATTPLEMKRLGRQVRNFTDTAWNRVKRAVVTAGNVAKFGQNPARRALLLGTGDRVLVEAAPRDRIWGIGFGAKNALQQRDRWGQNLLGKALMDARATLRADEAIDASGN